MCERFKCASFVLSLSFVLSACGGAGPDADAELGSTATVQDELGSGERYFVPLPDAGAVKQIAGLVKKGQLSNAARLTAMVATPQAVWFTGGTPKEVGKSVRSTLTQAKQQRRTAVLVPYNIPFRDCAQYSSGGAIDTAEYEAWITAFAKAIGDAHVVVILEPDSLGIIPYNTTIYGVEEWCKPTVVAEDGSTVPAPGASATERYAQLSFAVAKLRELAPNADVYLDGTHSGWLGVGEAAYRLARAGRDPATRELLARGFYLNASNYQSTEQATQFGTWISMCTAFATNPEEGGWRLGNYGWCASQYNPDTDYQLDYSPAYAASVTAQIQGLMGTATASLPFVIDTSRNGRGPLEPSRYGAAPYNQPSSVLDTLKNGGWCNPPGAGVGPRPKATPGPALVDAYLWVKIPGQSDGQCDSNGGARAWDYSLYNPWRLSSSAQGTFDPLWGQVDPAAGEWFPAQALELAQKAAPPLF